MIFQITNVGTAAALAASTGGPLINVTTFKIGDAVNYTPAVTDTDLHGNLLYTGAVSAYNVLNVDLAQWVLIMNANVGDFEFGEVGLYLDTGELFALASFPDLVTKASTISGNANVITINAELAYSGIAPLIQFDLFPTSVTRAVEIPSVDLLFPPVSLQSSSNFYVAENDDFGSRIYAIKKDDFEWSLYNFTPLIDGTVMAGTNTPNQITSTDIGLLLDNFAPGRYLIQFLTGAHAGFVRYITAQGTHTCSWNGSLDNAPLVGDTFRIYVSLNYLISQAIVTAAQITEIVSVDDLLPPSLSINNVYLCNNDDSGKRILAFKKNSMEWSFNDFERVLSGTVDSATTTLVDSSDIQDMFSIFATGRFIIQFTSGPNQGLARMITAQAFDQLEWSTAFSVAPDNGDTFIVYASNRYIQHTPEISSVDDLPVPNKSTHHFIKCNTDDGNKTIIAYKNFNNWNFVDFDVVTSDVVATATTTSLTSGISAFNVDALGRYLVRFNSGANAGLVRAITVSVLNEIEWSTPLPNAPTNGDSFSIFVSQFYKDTLNLKSANNLSDIASVEEARRNLNIRDVEKIFSIYWTETESGIFTTSDNINEVHYSNFKWVFAGDKGLLVSSPDLRNWSSNNNPQFATSNIYSVVQRNDIWMLAGEDGKISTSIDNAETWTARTSGFGTSDIYRIRYLSGNNWLAVGEEGKVSLSSNNGTTWSLATVTFTSSESVRDIYSDSFQSIIVGDNGKINRSVDSGFTWTNIATTITEDIYSIRRSENFWVFTCSDGQVYKSVDLANFEPVPNNFGSSIIKNALFYENLWYFVSENGQIGVAFSGLSTISDMNTNLVFGSLDINTIHQGLGIIVAAGEEGKIGFHVPNIKKLGSFSTISGAGWLSANDSFGNDSINGIHFSGTHWIAVGDAGRIGYSGDGVNYAAPANTTFGSSDVNSIWKNPNTDTWIAVGEDGKLAKSTDNGLTWTQKTSQFTTNHIYDVHFYSGTWIAVGDNGLMSRSTDDGETWAVLTDPNFGTDTIYCIYSDGSGRWIAGGADGKIRYSDHTDINTTWASVTSQFSSDTIQDIHFGNGVWVAGGGAGKISISVDNGATWTSKTSGMGGDEIRGVHYFNNLWMACGQNTKTVKSQDDADTWAIQDNEISGSVRLNYITTGGANLWVMVSNGGDIFLTSNPLISSSEQTVDVWDAANFPINDPGWPIVLPISWTRKGSRLFVVAYLFKNSFYQACVPAIFISDDGGVNYTEVWSEKTSLVYNLVNWYNWSAQVFSLLDFNNRLIFDGNNIFVGIPRLYYDGEFVWNFLGEVYSNDNGDTWFHVANTNSPVSPIIGVSTQHSTVVISNFCYGLGFSVGAMYDSIGPMYDNRIIYRSGFPAYANVGSIVPQWNTISVLDSSYSIRSVTFDNGVFIAAGVRFFSGSWRVFILRSTAPNTTWTLVHEETVTAGYISTTTNITTPIFANNKWYIYICSTNTSTTQRLLKFESVDNGLNWTYDASTVLISSAQGRFASLSYSDVEDRLVLCLAKVPFCSDSFPIWGYPNAGSGFRVLSRQFYSDDSGATWSSVALPDTSYATMYFNDKWLALGNNITGHIGNNPATAILTGNPFHYSIGRYEGPAQSFAGVFLSDLYTYHWYSYDGDELVQGGHTIETKDYTQDPTFTFPIPFSELLDLQITMINPDNETPIYIGKRTATDFTPRRGDAANVIGSYSWIATGIN